MEKQEEICSSRNNETSITLINCHSRRPSSPHHDIHINRPLFRSKDFYTKRSNLKSSFKFKCSLTVKPWHYLNRLFTLLSTYLPILHWFPRYSLRRSLPGDILAALMLATCNISDGMAFGWLAGLTPMIGLYMSIFPVVVYAIFGRSRHLSVGTFPIVSIVCHHVLEASHAAPLPDNFTQLDDRNVTSYLQGQNHGNAKVAVELLTSLALLVGVLQLLVGIFRLELLFSLLSDTILSAFMTAVPIHILINQIFPLLGISRSDSTPVQGTQDVPFKLIKSCTKFIMQFTEKFNATTTLFSLSTITILFSWKYLLEPRLKKSVCFFQSLTLPVDFIVITAATTIFHYLNEVFKEPVATIALSKLSDSPLYIQPVLPNINLWPNLLPTAFLITFVTFSGAYSTGRVYAKKDGYQIKSSPEMMALGAANAFSSFFQCYPCAVSSTRSSIQRQINQKTQMASLISVLLVGLFAHFAMNYLTSLPVFVLSSIIVTATLSLFYNKIKETFSILKISCKSESIVWIGTFFAILFFGVRYGLIIGILTSLLFVFFKIIRPQLNIKNAIPDSECYIADSETATSPQIIKSGVLVFEIVGPLIYLSVEHLRHRFRKTVIETIKCNRQRNESIFTVSSLCANKLSDAFHLSTHMSSESYAQTTIHSVILDCSPMPFIDRKGVHLITEFENELTQTASSVKLLLANCNIPVFQTLKQMDFFTKFDPNRCFVSVHDAATAYTNISLRSVTYVK